MLIRHTALTLIACAFVATPLMAANKKPAPIVLHCPNVNQLKYDAKTMRWHADGGWKSYTQSFAKHLNVFLGAQWRGVSIGQINCLYAAKGHVTFPVSLSYNKLTREPKLSKSWSKNYGGYRNCRSKKLADCKFTVVQKKKAEDPFAVLSHDKDNSQPDQAGL